MINVKPEEVDTLAIVMNSTSAQVKEKYIEESMQGQLIMNTIPCHFLVEKKCSIYEHRFTECRDFPHLHKPGFIQRFSGTIMHYGSCPIIYNVIELLKHNMNFNADQQA
jgi:Fe-S-cluster containining protein